MNGRSRATHRGRESGLVQRLTFIERGLAAGMYAFNPSICEYRGRLLMAYRLAPFDGPHRIVIAELDSDFAALSNAPVHIVPAEPYHHHEDPRLFVFGEKLWLSATRAIALPGENEWATQQIYAELEPRDGAWTGVARIPRYGDNDGDGQEKNWTFFDSGGRLYALYDPTSWTFLAMNADGTCAELTGSGPPPVWSYGNLSGGTPPLPMPNGELFTLLHSFTRLGHARVYHVAAAIFNPHPPFELVRSAQMPLISGSERWPFPPVTVRKHQPRCVFPGGHLFRDDRVIVSMGINDCHTAIAELSFEAMPFVDAQRSHRFKTR